MDVLGAPASRAGTEPPNIANSMEGSALKWSNSRPTTVDSRSVARTLKAGIETVNSLCSFMDTGFPSALANSKDKNSDEMNSCKFSSARL